MGKGLLQFEQLTEWQNIGSEKGNGSTSRLNTPNSFMAKKRLGDFILDFDVIM